MLAGLDPRGFEGVVGVEGLDMKFLGQFLGICMDVMRVFVSTGFFFSGTQAMICGSFC